MGEQVQLQVALVLQLAVVVVGLPPQLVLALVPGLRRQNRCPNPKLTGTKAVKSG